MKKVAFRLLFIVAIFASMGVWLVSCGDPYKNLKMDISSSGISYNYTTERNEFVLTDTNKVFTLTSIITGGDNSVNRFVNISIEQPTDVVEFSEDTEIAHSGNETTASFTVKNGGYATINFVSKEGGLVARYKVYVVIPIQSITANTASDEFAPIERGVETDLINLLNNSSIYEYLKFYPENTNQKDMVAFSLEDNVSGVFINGTKIKVTDNFSGTNFTVFAKCKNAEGGDISQSINFKVLDAFDESKLSISNNDTEITKDADSGKYILKLSTNINEKYESTYQGFLSFTYKYNNSNTVNILDYDNIMSGTKYSIKTEKDKNQKSINATNQNLEVLKTYDNRFNITHKNINTSQKLKFFINYLGYEEFFNDIELEVYVEVSAFPESFYISEQNDSSRIDKIIVYNSYTGMIGSEFNATIMGPDDKALDLEKYKLIIPSGFAVFKANGFSYDEIKSGETEILSGTQLYIKRNSSTTTDDNDLKLKFISCTTGNVTAEIAIKTVSEDVSWNGVKEETIYLDFAKTEQQYVFKNASWFGRDCTNLNIENFKINSKSIYSLTNNNQKSVEISNNGKILLTISKITLEGFKINTNQNLGDVSINIETPNGNVLTLNVNIYMNLSGGNLYASLNNYINDTDNKIPVFEDGVSLRTYEAVVGNQQTISVLLQIEQTTYTLTKGSGLINFQIVSGDAKSVLVDNDKIIANTISSYAVEIKVNIKGYKSTNNSITNEPSIMNCSFKFLVHVKSTVNSISTSLTNSNIFLYDTLGEDEQQTKGNAELHLTVNPNNVSTNYNIGWSIYDKINGTDLISIKADDTIVNNTSNSPQSVSYGNGGINIYYELKSDGLDLILYTKHSSAIDRTMKNGYFYVFTYVVEEYTDLFGNSHRSVFTAQKKVTYSSAVQIEKIVAEVSDHTISFDKRVLKIDENNSDGTCFHYVRDKNNSYKFNYSINPSNPQNDKIQIWVSDASIGVSIDIEKREVEVWVNYLSKNVTPVFVITMRTCDNASIVEERVVVNIQDGKNVAYELKSEDDFIDFSNHIEEYATSNFVIVNDIIISSNAFNPIGTIATPFSGKIDGIESRNNIKIQHFISINLSKRSNINCYGLFGVVKNATLNNIYIKGISYNISQNVDENESILIGGLVGLAIDSQINNVIVEDGNKEYSINNVSSLRNTDYGINANVVGNGVLHIGGIAGALLSIDNAKQSSEINNSNAYVRIYQSGESWLTLIEGGIVGYVSKNSTIRFSNSDNGLTYNVVSLLNYSWFTDNIIKKVSESNSAFGGLVGINCGTIENGIIQTMIFGQNHVGGIAGINTGTINGTIIQGRVFGTNYIGGAVGLNIYNNNAESSVDYKLENSQVIKTNKTNEYIGTLESVKVQFIDYQEKTSIYNTAIYGISCLGGLIGKCDADNINNSIASYCSIHSYINRELSILTNINSNKSGSYFGDIVFKEDSNNKYLGGLVGYATNIKLEYCYASVHDTNAGIGHIDNNAKLIDLNVFNGSEQVVNVASSNNINNITENTSGGLLVINTINSDTGWDTVAGKPSDDELENYVYYKNENINNGNPILFGKEKSINGKVNLIIDIAPLNIEVNYNYSNDKNRFQTRTQTNKQPSISDDNVIGYTATEEALDNEITLQYYEIDSKKLTKLFGYYDFNQDKKEPNTAEKFYSAYLDAYVNNLNTYKLSDILQITTIPAYTNVGALNIKSNSKLIEIGVQNNEMCLILKGSGFATLELTSKYNSSLHYLININIINRVSGVSLYKDFSKLNSLDGEIQIIKGRSEEVFFKLDEYLDNIYGISDNYGKVALCENKIFNLGVRFYIYDADGNALVGFPDALSINGERFTNINGEYFIDCDNINSITILGLQTSTYIIRAVPYIKLDDNKKVLLQNTSDYYYVIKIINGTFDLSTAVDSATDPFSPSVVETIVQTDDINNLLYISIQNENNDYLTIQELGSYQTSIVNEIDDTKRIYLLEDDTALFTADKFYIQVISIKAYDINNNEIDFENVDRLAYKKYQFKILVLDDYKYSINKQEKFKISFYTVINSGDVDKYLKEVSFDYTINPQSVESVTLNHYADITVQTYDVSTGKENIIVGINQSFVSNTLVCGQSGLLHIAIHPGYSQIDELRISSSSTSGYKVSLEQMYANYISNVSEELKDKHIFGGYYTSIHKDDDKINNIINNGLGIKLDKISYGYYENSNIYYAYNGNLYIRTNIPTLYDETIRFTITLEGYVNGEKVINESIVITPQLTPKLIFDCNGKTSVAVAVGTDVTLNLSTDGTIDESSKFNLILKNNVSEDITAGEYTRNDNINDTIYKTFIFNKAITENNGKYVFKIPYNEEIIGKEFTLSVTSYKIINNNRYETTKTIDFIISKFVVTDIYAERVENYNGDLLLKGNYNQQYALKAVVEAHYVSEKQLTTYFSIDETVASNIVKNIQREIEKLEALITSKGLFGEYESLEGLDNNQILQRQDDARYFGQKDNYKTTTWYYLYGNVLTNLSTEQNYAGIKISNARAGKLYLQTENGQIVEPYAMLNVQVTDTNTQAKICLSVSLDYNEDGLPTFDMVKSKYVEDFECIFGFRAIQLANEENPEPIYTVEEFKKMRAGVPYILMNDIELEYWEPLNTEILSFDGNGYVIRLKNFNDFKNQDIKNIGLFGTVGKNTTLKNIILEIVPRNAIIQENKKLNGNSEVDYNVEVKDLASVQFGFIAGENNGIITNCIVINNADSYRNERNATSEIVDRSSFYSTYIKENSLANVSNRTSSIVKVWSKTATKTNDVRISGFVGVNNGYITNSAVENISIIGTSYVSGFVCENSSSAKISSSYFKGANIVNYSVITSTNYTNTGSAGFCIFNDGDISYSYVYGREVTEQKLGETINISGVDASTEIIDKENGKTTTYADAYIGFRYTYSNLTNGKNSTLVNFAEENGILYNNYLNVRALGSTISSVGYASGFIYSNNGNITDCYSNIFIEANYSSGFVFSNSSNATINNSFTLSSIHAKDADHNAFSGVIYDGTTTRNLNSGKFTNCYYLNVSNSDYQQLFDIYVKASKESSDATSPSAYDLISKSNIFVNSTEVANTNIDVNKESLWLDNFGESESDAVGLTASEFAAYTSFSTFSFNSDYSGNGMDNAEDLVRAVWFIPTATTNSSSNNSAIAKYFKHQTYTSRVPQLVSANLKTTSLRYANFIPQLPANTDIDGILKVLSNDMGYKNVAKLIGSANGLTVAEKFRAIISPYNEVTNEYGCGYQRSELAEEILKAYIEIKNVSVDNIKVNNLEISGSNTIETIMSSYFNNDDRYNNESTGYKHLDKVDILEILITAVNAINAIGENSDTTYSYSYTLESTSGVNILYGESVLNPYLISSAERFNTYILQINTLGEETELTQDSYYRFIKDIYFDNIIDYVRTYKSTFVGDLDGNNMTITDLKIVAENEFVIANDIQQIGLFKEITKNENNSANIRNLNIQINNISASAVRCVGALAGEISGGCVSNIYIYGSGDAIINGFNATGGLAGYIYGDDKTIISNVKTEVSVKSNYYSSPANSYSTKNDDNKHRFNLFHEKDININEISYAGGIAGLLNTEKNSTSANVRNMTVSSNISIRGEVVGGLFGFVGVNSIVSNSKFIASNQTKLIASAVAGGLVGHLEGIITTSSAENKLQSNIDKVVYDTVSNASSGSSTIDLSINIEDENVDMYSGNAHYIGGIAGLSYNGFIEYSFNRVDVANINSKYAGGIVGLSIGLNLTDVYTTASVFSFISYGGIVGLQTIELHEDSGSGTLYKDDILYNYYINNWSDFSRNQESCDISLKNVVGANIWKDAHKVVNRKTYRIDAYQAEIGSFIGRAMCYNETYTYKINDTTMWYNTASNPITQRVKTESVYFMMAYAKNGKEIIYEIGNATKNVVSLGGEISVVTNSDSSADGYVVNLMQYKSNNVTYAYSGDYTSKLSKKENPEDEADYSFYRFSRLQNFGSLRTIREFINGVYLQAETKTILNVVGDNNTLDIKNSGEYDLNTIHGTGGDNQELYESSRAQRIYENWRQDSWFGTVSNATDGRRVNISSYLFPQVRTRVYEDVIYVYSVSDLISNTERLPDRTYIIMNDIDLDVSSDGWKPLNSSDNPFRGTLKSYGNYKIYGLKQTSFSGTFGLFAFAEDATFYNFSIEVENVRIQNGENFGGLVGDAKNCEFDKITITLKDCEINANNIGGLVGKLTGANAITNSIVYPQHLKSTTAENIGGFVGLNEGWCAVGNSLLLQSNFNIESKNCNVGGIIGCSKWLYVLNEVGTSGNISFTANNANIGGLIGFANIQNIQVVGEEDIILTSVEKSLSNINIDVTSANNNIGGLIGKISSGVFDKIVDCYSTGYINAESGNVGGLIGYYNKEAKGFSFTSSYSMSKICVNNDSCGGVIGKYNKTDNSFAELLYTYDFVPRSNSYGTAITATNFRTKTAKDLGLSAEIWDDGINDIANTSIKYPTIKSPTLNRLQGEGTNQNIKVVDNLSNIINEIALCYTGSDLDNLSLSKQTLYLTSESCSVNSLSLDNLSVIFGLKSNAIENINNNGIISEAEIGNINPASKCILLQSKVNCSKNNTYTNDNVILYNSYIVYSQEYKFGNGINDIVSIETKYKYEDIQKFLEKDFDFEIFWKINENGRPILRWENDPDKWEPTGTLISGNSYDIRSAEDLVTFANSWNSNQITLNKTFNLRADIDLSEKLFTPIGTKENPFKCTFNGNGYTISNLIVFEKDSAGLFGYVSAGITGCAINNLNIESGIILSYGKNGVSGGFVGTIVGSHQIILNNCEIQTNGDTNRLIVAGNTAGGIIGINNVTTSPSWTKQCAFEGIVYGITNAGGILGYQSDKSDFVISNCYISNGNLTSDINKANILGKENTNIGSLVGAGLNNNKKVSLEYIYVATKVKNLNGDKKDYLLLYPQAKKGAYVYTEPENYNAISESLKISKVETDDLEGSLLKGFDWNNIWVRIYGENNNYPVFFSEWTRVAKVPNKNLYFNYVIENKNLTDETEQENLDAIKGTTDCIEICTVSELAWIARIVNAGVYDFEGKNIKILNHLDFSSKTWTPIGIIDHKFKGNIIADDQVILKNITAQNSEIDCLGLMGYVDSITIKNIKIESSTFGNIGENMQTGAVGCFVGVGTGNITIENCIANCKINSNQNMIGGFIGKFDGEKVSIKNSTNNLNITGDEYVGGFVGYAIGDIEINNSTNNGAINDAINGADNVGGLVGYVEGNVKIINSTNSGNVTGKNHIGGFVGYLDGDLTISENSVNNKNVTGDEYVGGLVGYIKNSTISISAEEKYVVNSALVNGAKYVGGIIGMITDSKNITFTNLQVKYNYGNIVIGKGSYIGGLVGYLKSSDTLKIENCENLSNVGINSSSAETSNDYIGGLIGYLEGKTIAIDTCKNTGAVSSKKDGNNIGGLFGYVSASDEVNISNSENSGSITGMNNVGGIIGYCKSKKANFSDVLNNGGVNGKSNGSCFGGIVGLIDDGNVIIENSQNEAGIGASLCNNIGGIVGKVSEDANVSIIDAKNTANIYGTDFIGGLVGYGENINISVNALEASETIIENCLKDNDKFIIKNKYYTLNSGSVDGSRYIGGFVGYSNGLRIVGNQIQDEITTEGDITINTYTINWLKNTGVISTTFSYMGGIVGQIDGEIATNKLEYVVNSGSISQKSNVQYVGGISGRANVNAKMLKNTGNIINNFAGLTYSYCGGLFGYLKGSLELSSNEGKVDGKSYSGGVIGKFVYTEGCKLENLQNNGTVENALNLGDSIKSSTVGVLIGCMKDTEEKSYYPNSSFINYLMAGNSSDNNFENKQLIGEMNNIEIICSEVDNIIQSKEIYVVTFYNYIKKTQDNYEIIYSTIQNKFVSNVNWIKKEENIDENQKRYLNLLLLDLSILNE